jgi:microcystin-dependent protein
VRVARDSSGTFDTVGEELGAETTTLTEAQLPVHDHSIDHNHAAVTSAGQSASHTHDMTHAHAESGDTGGTGFSKRVPGSGSSDVFNAGSNVNVTYHGNPGTSTMSGSTGAASADHTHSVDLPAFSGNSGNAGSGDPHSNLQPSVTVVTCVYAGA